MKLLKFSLLITPSIANAEKGFSVLNLLSIKPRNALAPESLRKLMQLILLGPYIEDLHLNKKLLGPNPKKLCRVE